MDDCFFCENIGGTLLFSCKLYRIILVDSEVNYPGYTRIVVNRHIKEISDLAKQEAASLYHALYECEKILRNIFKPDKINLASFGNITPHVHWHIIPRYINDKHYPNPVWGAPTNLAYCPDHKLLGCKDQLIGQFKSFAI